MLNPLKSSKQPRIMGPGAEDRNPAAELARVDAVHSRAGCSPDHDFSGSVGLKLDLSPRSLRNLHNASPDREISSCERHSPPEVSTNANGVTSLGAYYRESEDSIESIRCTEFNLVQAAV